MADAGGEALLVDEPDGSEQLTHNHGPAQFLRAEAQPSIALSTPGDRPRTLGLLFAGQP